MSESQTALIFNLKFANINFSRVTANEAAWRNLDTFHWTEKFFFSTERYFQSNSDREAHRTEIIQKWGIGFQDNIFDGNIWYVVKLQILFMLLKSL